MRTTDQLDETECWDFLANQPHGNLAGCTPQGKPILRTMNHAILDGALYFHGKNRGEKLELVGQSVVFACEKVVAQIPSHWRDPVLACPATTWYHSAQARGQLETVVDYEIKARAMDALMNRIQPEGGYLPIATNVATYEKALRAMLMFRLEPTGLTGRLKIGQGKHPDDLARILEGLWRRGMDQDLLAIEMILAGNEQAQRPAALLAPGGIELLVVPDRDLSAQAARLLEHEYWNGPYNLHALADAQLHSDAWIGARDPKTGSLVGTAAALANKTKQAFLYDIVVDPSYQKSGIGTAMVKALLDHPRVRGTQVLRLRTKDAGQFYRPLGFVNEGEVHDPIGATTMVCRRTGSPSSAP